MEQNSSLKAAQPQSIAEISAEIRESVTASITKLVDEEGLAMPSGFNAANAIRKAILVITNDVKDKNNVPAIKACKKGSIAQSILDMVVQGLMPERKQGYFIVYGDSLTFQRSYFGTVAALKRAVPEVYKVVSGVIYEKDTPEYSVTRFNQTYVSALIADPLNDRGKPVGGYCTIYDRDANVLDGVVMKWEQIQTSWKQSRNCRQGGVHDKFPEEMAKRTLISRACKMMLNTSIKPNDAVVESFNRTTESEFMDEQNAVEPEPRKLSFKERYNIGNHSEEGNVNVEENNSEEESVEESEEGVIETPQTEDEYPDELFGEPDEDPFDEVF